MALFWTLAVLMTVVALAFVLVPLLRPRPAASPSRMEANLDVLRGQRREIDADIANGTLPADEREHALEELVGRADQDLVEPEAMAAMPQPTGGPRPWKMAAVVGVALPALVFGIYLALGNPAATDARLAAAAASTPDEKQIVQMVEALAVKVKQRPDDVQGWALLARSMGSLGRFNESAEAYAHLAKLVPDNADVLADYADALGMAQGRTLAGKPAEIIQQALRVDPKHRKSLALAGTVALDAGDLPNAARYWQALAAELPPGSADEAQVQGVLGEIRQRAAAAGKPLPAPAANVAATSSKAAGTSVSGSVSVAPGIAARIAGDESLFVFARAENGSRVPLAVIRSTARELPLRYALDDSQAMAAGMTISSTAAMRIEARVSKSGSAAPQPGDLVGSSTVVKPGARDVKVVIDKVLP